MNGPRSAALAAQLPEIGLGLAVALEELSRDPEPTRAELVAIRLDGARRHCLLLSEARRRESTEERGHER